MENTDILQEITPLESHDFMYVADRHKAGYDYPLHRHDLFEMNFVEHGAGCERIVGDSVERLGEYDLVLISSPNLEHQWAQGECQSHDIHEITIQFFMDFHNEKLFDTNAMRSVKQMLIRAERGLAFPLKAIMAVYPRLIHISQIKEGFYSMSELFHILYELSKFDDARGLVDTNEPVSQICFKTGFNTLTNFNRLFKKRKGCSPTEFREKYAKTKVIV